MPRKARSGTSRIDLDIAFSAQQRFTKLHESLGFKTKAETLEAIIFAISSQDIIDPHAIARIERKLDEFMEIVETHP